MLDPKRFSPTGPVAEHDEREALVQSKETIKRMIRESNEMIKNQLLVLAKNNASHIHPSSFPDIYSSGEYTDVIFEINSWFLEPAQIKNGIVPTTLPRNSKAVIEMETRQKEKKELLEELNRIVKTIGAYDRAPDAASKRTVLEGYYNESHTNEIYRSNDRKGWLGTRGMGANHNIRKMEKNDKQMDKIIAAQTADPNNVVLKAAGNVTLHFRSNYEAVLRGRKVRAESEQKVILLSHALKVQKYRKKKARAEAKRDAANAAGNVAKADKYQAKADKYEDKINKPISVWKANAIILKESAKDLFRLHRTPDDYRPWEVRRAEELEKQVSKKL